jgi:hypothetical protein
MACLWADVQSAAFQTDLLIRLIQLIISLNATFIIKVLKTHLHGVRGVIIWFLVE